MTLPSLFTLLAGPGIVLAVVGLSGGEPDSPRSNGASEPDFGPHVLVFDPAMTNMQERIDEVFARQEASQFGPDRYAYLFKPGRYELDVQMGFYMQILGLGRSPDDVSITGAVRSKARWLGRNNTTCHFWRCAENLAVTPTMEGSTNIWAVSQATALRRVHVKGNLHLWDGGWSSGGFMADSVVDGEVNSGSQQQWQSRNADWGQWKGGAWNMVFVGTSPPPPAGTWPEAPYTVIDRTPVIREKPFLSVDEQGRYFVMVPELRQSSRGMSWSDGASGGTIIPISQFHLAHPDRDSAASLNEALQRGKHLLFTPGLYPLEDSLRVARPGAVVLGLGYATLQPTQGTPALVIADVDGVKVGGLLVEAGSRPSSTLVQVGEPGASVSHAAGPVFVYDLFCRAWGAQLGKADCFLTIHPVPRLGATVKPWVTPPTR